MKRPCRTSGSDLRKVHIALPNAQRPAFVCGPAGWESRQMFGKALGVPLSGVDPAPATCADLLPWYFSAVNRVDPVGRQEYQRLHKKYSRDYWLVFSAPIPDGETMFAIHWHSRSAAPLAVVGGGSWMVDGDALPCQVPVAELPSATRRRFAGSEGEVRSTRWLWVGWQRARATADIGWGRSVDRLRSRNIHGGEPLPPCPVGERHRPAQGRVARARNRPAAPVGGSHLLGQAAGRVAGLAVLEPFDLVVIAIGSPTVERIFAEYCRQETLDVPVMNCWLEAMESAAMRSCDAGAKGCWNCAYVDPETLTRGLTSNLNFLKPGRSCCATTGAARAVPPLQRDRRKLYGDDGRGFGRPLTRSEVATSSKVSWKGAMRKR